VVLQLEAARISLKADKSIDLESTNINLSADAASRAHVRSDIARCTALPRADPSASTGANPGTASTNSVSNCRQLRTNRADQ
jgi:hypothetical protein